MKKIAQKAISSLVIGTAAMLVMSSAFAVNVTAATPQGLAEAVGSNSGVSIIFGLYAMLLTGVGIAGAAAKRRCQG